MLPKQSILVIPCSANPSLNIYVAYCMCCWCAAECAPCSAMYSFHLQACHPNKAPLCRPLFSPTQVVHLPETVTQMDPMIRTCGNRLSEGSQPATREVTREVKLSLSVPFRVHIDHKPYGACNQNNKGSRCGLVRGGWGTRWLLLEARWALGNIWKISFLSGGGLTLGEERAWNAKEGRRWGQMAGLCAAQSALCGAGVTWSRMESVGVCGGLDNVLTRHKHLHVSYGGKSPACIWPW